MLGLLVFGKISRLMVLTAGVAVAALAFSFVYHPADADVYLLPLLISFSIWLGIGVGELAELLFKRSPALAMAISLLILGMVLFRSLSHYQQVDASHDSRAEDFARQILTQRQRMPSSSPKGMVPSLPYGITTSHCTSARTWWSLPKTW